MDNILSKLSIATINVSDYISNKYNLAKVAQVLVFEQVWGSTSLCFSGIGGSTMTSAWTHVVSTYDGKHHVSFSTEGTHTPLIRQMKNSWTTL